MLPTISGTFRLSSDPELRFTPSGKAVCNIPLVANSRKRNMAGEYEDDKVLFLNGTLWEYAAEHAAESLTRGTEVVVTGQIYTENYETREGEKRSATRLMITSIGPTIRWNPVRVLRSDRPAGLGVEITGPVQVATYDSGAGAESDDSDAGNDNVHETSSADPKTSRTPRTPRGAKTAE